MSLSNETYKTFGYFDNCTVLQNASDASNESCPTSAVDESFGHIYWDQYSEMIKGAPPAFLYAVGVYITIISTIGILGNLTVIWIFSSTPSLKTPSNLYVINLAICDVTFSLINGFPIMSIACFERKWLWGDAGCVWYAFIGGVSGLASINTLAAISLDRYLVIARPLQMMHKASKTRSFQHIFLIWCWALAWTLPPWFGWGSYIPEGFGVSCTFDYLTRTKANIAFVYCLFGCGFLFPVCLIIGSYSGIVVAVGKNRKQMSAMSNDRQTEQRQELKIAKVVAINIVLFLISWLPYATVSQLGINGHVAYVTPYSTELPVILAKASGAWNPIIYALTHPRFRAALLGSKLPFKHFLRKSSTHDSVATRNSEVSASVDDRSTRKNSMTTRAPQGVEMDLQKRKVSASERPVVSAAPIVTISKEEKEQKMEEAFSGASPNDVTISDGVTAEVPPSVTVTTPEKEDVNKSGDDNHNEEGEETTRF